MRIGNPAPLLALALAFGGLLAVTGLGWKVMGGELAAAPTASRVLGPRDSDAPRPWIVPSADRCAVRLVDEPETTDTWTLSGVVRDDLGRPLPGALVQAGARGTLTDA